MPFLLMLFLTLVCLPERWSRPPAWVLNPGLAVALTWVAVALHVAAARLIVGRVRHLMLVHSLDSDAASSFYGRARTWHSFALLALFTICLYVFGWGWAVQSLWSHDGQVLPCGDLLILTPFLVALVLSWMCFYDAEHALHYGSLELFALGVTSADPACLELPPFWTRWGYTLFHARQNLALVFIPVLLLIVEKEIRRLIPPQWQFFQGAALGIGAALLLFLAMPWVLKLILGLKSLPDSPLRQRLMATSQRLGFRCTDVLLWNTRGGMANAMVAGVLPWLRYVLLSDRLIEDLTPDEVEAVFGHEIGHVKHHHMLYYLVFLMSSIFVLGMALTPVLNNLDGILHFNDRPDLTVLPLVVALAGYVFVVFGFISRRCERQADVFGCRVASPDLNLTPEGIHIFVRALEKVAFLNGMSRDRPGFLQSWQHSTIARRVAFLLTLIDRPQQEPVFQRRVLLLKAGLLAALAVVFLGLYAGGLVQITG